MTRPEPVDYTLSAAEARLMLFMTREFISLRWFANKPISRSSYAVRSRLASFVDETKTCASQPHSASSEPEELIDTNAAAEILGCTPQWVGKIRDRLGVRQIGSQRVFSRQTVVDYAERKAAQR